MQRSANVLAGRFSLPELPSVGQVADDADVCIAAVADAAIEDVITPLHFMQTTLLHCAGSVPMELLRKSAANTGVVWPVYSIRKGEAPDARDFPCMIEWSTEAASPAIEAVAAAFSDHSFKADSTQRAWLHLAAVMGNNFINHLLTIIADICAAHALPPDLLRPLIEQTVRNAGGTYPAAIQTGPARRGDDVTIARHLQMLESLPGAQAVYSVLSESIAAHMRAVPVE